MNFSETKEFTLTLPDGRVERRKLFPEAAVG